MIPRRPRTLAGLTALAAASLVLASDPTGKKPAPQPSFTAQQVALFEKEALPILQKNCFKCHGGGKKLRGGLRLTSRATILEGGDTGPAVSLDKPGDSLLLRAISYKHRLQMPPTGRLPPAPQT